MQQQGWGGNKTAAAKRMIFQFPKVQTTKKAYYNSILLKAIYEHIKHSCIFSPQVPSPDPGPGARGPGRHGG